MPRAAKENYHIGLRARVWGVEDKYRKLIEVVGPGDTVVFSVNGSFRSIHTVESEPL